MNETIMFEWLNYFTSFIYNYLPLISFLVPIIGGGEIGIIALALYFVRDLSTYLIIFLFCAAGMVFIDSLWFLIVRFRLIKRLTNKMINNNHYKYIESRIEKFFRNNDFITILIMKVMAGTRVLFIFYLSNRKISFKRYFFLIIIVNLIWSFVLTGIGLLGSLGYGYLIDSFNNIIIGVTFLISILLILYICQELLRKKFLLGKKI